MKAFLVYWQDVVDGTGGGIYERAHVVCMTEETRDAEMKQMVEKEKQRFEKELPGEDWNLDTPEEGAHFKEVEVLGFMERMAG